MRGTYSILLYSLGGLCDPIEEQSVLFFVSISFISSHIVYWHGNWCRGLCFERNSFCFSIFLGCIHLSHAILWLSFVTDSWGGVLSKSNIILYYPQFLAEFFLVISVLVFDTAAERREDVAKYPRMGNYAVPARVRRRCRSVS